MSPEWRDKDCFDDRGPWARAAPNPEKPEDNYQWSNRPWKCKTNAEHTSYEVRK